jgi:hypothetical protein
VQLRQRRGHLAGALKSLVGPSWTALLGRPADSRVLRPPTPLHSGWSGNRKIRRCEAWPRSLWQASCTVPPPDRWRHREEPPGSRYQVVPRYGAVSISSPYVPDSPRKNRPGGDEGKRGHGRRYRRPASIRVSLGAVTLSPVALRSPYTCPGLPPLRDKGRHRRLRRD